MAKKKYASSMSLFGYSVFHPLNLILVLNCLVFILQLSASVKMTYLFALTPDLFLDGRYWQIFTYGFLHSTYFDLIPFHILMNMYGFYVLGMFIEPVIGKTKLVALYFAAQLGGGIFILGNALVAKYIVMPDNLQMIMTMPTLGASGAVFGLLAIFGLLYPDREILLLFFPVRAKNAVLILLVVGFMLEVFHIAPISNMGHLGGAVVGFIFYYFVIHSEENKIVFKITLTRDDYAKAVESQQESFKDQVTKSNQIKKFIQNTNSITEKENYLLSHQVSNANICPPTTYNIEDEFCLRCDWFANCMLRKVKTENEKHEN